MPTAIFEKLLAKSGEIARDENGQKGADLQQLAVMALLKGIESTEWKNYMKKILSPDGVAPEFTADPKELARLSGEDGTFNNSYQKQNLAYIVSNAICGTATGTGVHLRVSPSIDKDPV